jgi:hypothetical protein
MSPPEVCSSPTKIAIAKGVARSSSSLALAHLEQTCSLMMQLQLSGSHKLEAASEELSHLTRKPCNRKVIMSTPGALACIINMLSTPDTAVARYAAAAVQNLAIEPEHCQSLVTSGCMQPLFELLQASDEQEAVLAAAAGALSNLAYETQHCDMIAASPGCVQRLVQLLSHSSCVVREAGASVLGKLAWEPELCRPIAGEVVVLVLWPRWSQQQHCVSLFCGCCACSLVGACVPVLCYMLSAVGCMLGVGTLGLSAHMLQCCCIVSRSAHCTNPQRRCNLSK